MTTMTVPHNYGSFQGVSKSSTISAGIPGVFKKTHANVNAAVLPYLQQLRRQAGFDIVVTSGVRSPYSQAGVMITKWDTFGIARLRQLYGRNPDLVEEVIAARPLGQAGVGKVIERQVARGRYLSDHMRSDAIDLRTRGLKPAEQQKLLAAAKFLGAKAIMEEDHIHIEDISKAKGKAAAGVGGILFLLGAAAAVAWSFSR